MNGARALRLEPPATSPNLVGGFSDNAAQDGAHGVTIAGGGQAGAPNRVSDHFGTVGGGLDNRAGSSDGDPATALFATVAGGLSNTASDIESAVAGGAGNTADGLGSAVAGGAGNTASGDYSTVAGGNPNTASGTASAVAGGNSNTASGIESAVAGGVSNTASGTASAVPGGFANTASGDLSLAAGYRANATQGGAFVWADSNNFDIGSNGTNTFTARTTGGARFISAIDATTGAPTAGVSLTAGGGSWSSLSDRAAKRGFGTVDRRRLLNRLDRIPITSWSYKSQKPSIRHLGPMAQDFRSAFGLGEDSRHIDTIDSEGVALAAIQGLYRQNQALQRQNRALRARLTTHERQNAALSARLTRLERLVKGGGR